jgi:hypothetical protein
MRKSDVHRLIAFNTRMGMFICPEGREQVSAFLHGYEAGAAGACTFTKELSGFIAKRYRIPSLSTGWEGQIQELGAKLDLDWMATYRLVSSETLSASLRTDQAISTTRRRSGSRGRKQR